MPSTSPKIQHLNWVKPALAVGLLACTAIPAYAQSDRHDPNLRADHRAYVQKQVEGKRKRPKPSKKVISRKPEDVNVDRRDRRDRPRVDRRDRRDTPRVDRRDRRDRPQIDTSRVDRRDRRERPRVGTPRVDRRPVTTTVERRDRRDTPRVDRRDRRDTPRVDRRDRRDTPRTRTTTPVRTATHDYDTRRPRTHDRDRRDRTDRDRTHRNDRTYRDRDRRSDRHRTDRHRSDRYRRDTYRHDRYRRDRHRTNRHYRDHRRSNWRYPSWRRDNLVNRLRYNYRPWTNYHNHRGYRNSYYSPFSISFIFGNDGYSRYRWAPSRYHYYTPAYSSYSYYRHQTRCERVLVDALHKGHEEVISVEQCYNPRDGYFFIQGTERIEDCYYGEIGYNEPYYYD